MSNKRAVGVILSVVMLSSALSASYAETNTYKQGNYNDAMYRLGGYDAGYTPNYVCEDTPETKYFFKENFTYTSCAGRDTYAVSKAAVDGWDCDISGGELKGPYYVVTPYQLIDTSENAPVKISRSFEKADHGIVTLEAQMAVGADMDGASISLYSSSNETIRLETKNGKMYLMHPNGTDTELFSYTADTMFGIKLLINIDSGKIESIYKDGRKVGSNLDFSSDAEYIDKFVADTGTQTTGTLSFNMVHMYPGYYLNEKFTSSMGNVPNEFTQTNGASVVTKYSDMRPDVYSMQLKGSGAYAKRQFETASGKLKFSIKLYSTDSKDMKITLGKDNVSAAEVDIKDGKISCGSAATDFKSNIWNKITLELDPTTDKAKLYVNYREVEGNISYTADSINKITVSSNGGTMLTDDYLLEAINPLPEDYVPEIEKADSDGYYIGMQFCPMWEEGSHSGWDFENSVKAKTPYLGYYDQSSPEAMDWTIKQLAEHGVDFMKVTWMPPYDKSETKAAFIGDTFMDAYFNCEYASQMPFMIMWENSSDNNTTEEMLNRFAPYWIEYYFKNENYFKIDGRPVFQIYSPSSLVNCSGGTENCKTAIEQFRQMCIDAGVGNPIMVGAYDTSLAAEIGCEASIPYWLVGSSDFAESAYESASSAQGLDITTYPVMGPGVMDHGRNALLTPDEFKEQLIDLKTNYYTEYNNAGPLGNMLMLETYDEYTEGHWLAPSGIYGFGYLDAVREVFTSNGAHTDTVPTAAQKDRFNNLYPYGRTVNQLSTDIKDKSTDDLVVTKGWYFNNYQTQYWQLLDIDKSSSGKNLQGTATSSDPQVAIYNLDLDVTDVTYLKVRYKTDTPGAVQMFFTSDSLATPDEQNSLRISVSDTEWHDLYFYVGSLYRFTGKLNHLRLDPGSTKGASFEIDSIELLSKRKYDDVHFKFSEVGNLTADGKDVWHWDEGKTNLSYADGILTAEMSKKSAVYLRALDDSILTPFEKYRYIVLKMKTIPENDTFSVLVKGTEGWNENQRFRNMQRYDKGEYTYCVFDLSVKTIEEMQAQGLWQGDNLKNFRFDSNQDGTYEIADIYISSVFPISGISPLSLSTSSVSGGSEVFANVINTEFSGGMTGVLFTSLYKDNILLEVKQNYVIKLALGEKIMGDFVTVPDDISDGEYRVSAFLWEDNTSNLTPLCDAVSISE